ncbi:hypothetical protein EDC96DRAFT_547355 [Choanephora cucurbitarum]|nr:hypothetical protein EDC96DRAFT_547355 [Choanephora cucurbitarum]
MLTTRIASENLPTNKSLPYKQNAVKFSEANDRIAPITKAAPSSLRKLRYRLQIYDAYTTPTSIKRKLLLLLLLHKTSELSAIDKGLLGILKTLKINSIDLHSQSEGSTLLQSLQHANAVP